VNCRLRIGAWGTAAGTVLMLTVASAAPQTTAIRVGRLIDTDTVTATERQTILVVDGIIQAVGPNVQVPAGAIIVDLSDSTVFPGLMDAHTHLCLTVRPSRDGSSASAFLHATINDSNAARAVEGVVNARAMLEAGFTTVRDAGNEGNYACVAVRRAIEERRLVGPTMITSGRIITPFGGQFQIQPDRRGLMEPEYLLADSHDEMVKAIRENIYFGAGLIKIVVDDRPYLYSVDDIAFMKAEAARAGLRVAAHVWTAEGAHNAAAVGVASLEHLWAIKEEDLELAKKNGSVAVFTPLIDAETQILMPNESGVHAQQIGRIRAALRIGIPIAFGSDAPLALPGFDRGRLAIERIDMLLEAGMTPAQLLRSMTVIPAGLFGVADKRGALRPGMAADIVATKGNPLSDPRALKAITFVMKDGTIVVRRLSGRGHG